MELTTTQKDPLGILASTKDVVLDARFVSIEQDALQKIAEPIKKRFDAGFQFHSNDSISEESVQLLFIEDAVNFCFWAGQDEPKWQIERNDGTRVGGWYGLEACLKRAISESTPLLDARYLASLSEKDGAHLFRSANGVTIPLLEKRVENLREAGTVLLEKFNGQFANLLTAADNDAIQIVRLTAEHFPSFRDVSVLDGKPVFFYKRAQILPKDLSYVFEARGKYLANIDDLTAFADYKLPQFFRAHAVLAYSHELAERVDSYIPLAHDSREEIEIRAASVWIVELLRQILPGMTAADIDNTIWLLSQSLPGDTKPYHRTRTIFY
jgi:hypothetical protein